MLQRSTSPIFFARHPAASRAQDISRLLDPAYSSAAFAPNSAYVDRHGELHDPDYRHFPIAQPRRRASNLTVPTRPRWESFDDQDADDAEPEDDHFSPRRTSFSSYQQPRRPVYSYSSYVPAIIVPASCDSQDTVLADNDDDHSPRPSGVSRILSRTKREFARKRRSLDAASHSSSSPYYASALLTPDTPTTTTATVVSEEQEPETASLHAPSHHHPLSHTLSRFSCHSATPIHGHPSPPPEYTPTADPDREQQWTPTCSQALRRQWQAVSLRIRFSLFRTQRQIKSRLAMR